MAGRDEAGLERGSSVTPRGGAGSGLIVESEGVSGGSHETLARMTAALLKRSKAHHVLVAVQRGRGDGGAAADGSGGGAPFRWMGAAGITDEPGAPFTPDARFFIASISKMFVAAAVLRLHERGRLDLEHSIRQYLPGELVDGIHCKDGRDWTDRITLRHLITHTSGLADWLEDRPRGGRSVLERAMTEGDVLLAPAEIVEHVRERLTPHFAPLHAEEPGRAPRYSNTNFDLLMLIAEAVAGRPFEDVLADEVLQPLGLMETGFAGNDGDMKRAASVWLGSEVLDRPRLLRSTRTLNSSVKDLFAFMQALVRGELFQERSTWELMTAQPRRFGFPRDVAAMRAPQWPVAYAKGIMHFQFPPPMSLLVAMPPVIGHTGSTGTWLFYCPYLDLYLCGAISQAMGGPVPFRFVPKLLRELARRG